MKMVGFKLLLYFIIKSLGEVVPRSITINEKFIKLIASDEEEFILESLQNGIP